MVERVYITDPRWIESLRLHSVKNGVNFWRKDVRQVHLQPGSRFYFKLRGTQKIGGRAKFRERLTMPIERAWRTYGIANGVDSLSQFKARAMEVLKLLPGEPLTCLILDDLELLEPNKRPDISESLFSKYIMGSKDFEDGVPGMEPFFISGAARNQIEKGNISEDINALLSDQDLSPTERAALILARIGQGKFRTKVLAASGGRCCVTGCSIQQAIRASHIKPWRDCDKSERLDPDNGLALVANLDALFDAHLITFEDDGRILVSRRIGLAERKVLGAMNGLTSPPNRKMARYLMIHRSLFLENEGGRTAG